MLERDCNSFKFLSTFYIKYFAKCSKYIRKYAKKSLLLTLMCKLTNKLVSHKLYIFTLCNRFHILPMLIYSLYTEYWQLFLSCNIFLSWHATILQRRGNVYFCAVSEYRKLRSCHLQNVSCRPLLWDLYFCTIHYFLCLSNAIKQVDFFG